MTTTMLDRVVAWNLDLDGDIYGDERERFRWYEGIATAASLQWVAVPWAAAILVWVSGRPVVVPLTVILVVLMIPMAVCTAYVRRRRVDTVVRKWTRKRVVLSVAFTVPLLLFLFGALRDYGADSSTYGGALAGMIIGAVITAVRPLVRNRWPDRRTPVPEDED